jgi:hypothetical protein
VPVLLRPFGMPFGEAPRPFHPALGDTVPPEASRFTDEPVFLHLGQRVQYSGADWEVWVIESDGTVGLVRQAVGTRPHFLRIPATHLLRPNGRRGW